MRIDSLDTDKKRPHHLIIIHDPNSSVLSQPHEAFHWEGENMIKKIILSAFFVFVVAVTGNATASDNAAPLAGSYFQGVWVGSWPAFEDGVTQDVTIEIESGAGKGMFIATYSWGMAKFRSGLVPAGSIKTKGFEQGDNFYMKWSNKRGEDFKITLQKHKDNVAKAIIERSGTTNPKVRPYTETYLNRK